MASYFIQHRTRYIYSGLVIDSANQIKLYPIQDEKQRVKDHNIKVSGQPAISVFADYFGNKTGFFSILTPHAELSIDNHLYVDLSEEKKAARDSAADAWSGIAQSGNQILFHDFLKAEEAKYHSEILASVKELVRREDHPLDTVERLSQYIFDHFRYKQGVTTVETGIDELWNLGAGVCQDFAHLLLYMLRSLDIPSRYISGYICPGSSEWRGEGATHAWAEVWLPDLGWTGIDPTNKCIAGDRHVRLASGRNFSDCTPVKGTYKGSLEHTLEVTVQFSTTPFPKDNLQIAPTYIRHQEEGEGVPRNSYVAYIQMQQQ